MPATEDPRILIGSFETEIVLPPLKIKTKTILRFVENYKELKKEWNCLILPSLSASIKFLGKNSGYEKKCANLDLNLY